MCDNLSGQKMFCGGGIYMPMNFGHGKAVIEPDVFRIGRQKDALINAREWQRALIASLVHRWKSCAHRTKQSREPSGLVGSLLLGHCGEIMLHYKMLSGWAQRGIKTG